MCKPPGLLELKEGKPEHWDTARACQELHRKEPAAGSACNTTHLLTSRSFAAWVLERAAAVMESRTTAPRIPHWSELPLQTDTKRRQPPPEEEQVNIKLSDCLLLPAVWLAGTQRLRDAPDPIPLGVILPTSLPSCNSHSIQLSLCHRTLPPVIVPKNAGTCRGHKVQRVNQPVCAPNSSLMHSAWMCTI